MNFVVILATDVQYNEENAVAAGILFKTWSSDTISQEIIKPIAEIAPYEPGAFYKRELPCILALLEDIDIELTAIVVDGYVTLGEEDKPGLGAHLYSALNDRIPVIGVAKKSFIGTPKQAKILRGKSENPLYVTAMGMTLEEAKNAILNMHGQHRIPTLLKRVDQLCRGINC